MNKVKIPKGEKLEKIMPTYFLHTYLSRSIDMDKYVLSYINQEISKITSDVHDGRIVRAYELLQNFERVINSKGKVLEIRKYYYLNNKNQIQGKPHDMHVFTDLGKATNYKPDVYSDVARPISERSRKALHTEMIKDLERFGYKVTKDDNDVKK